MTILKRYSKIFQDEKFKNFSFNLLTDVIQDEVNKYGLDHLKTESALNNLKSHTKNLSDVEFAFLLSHSCYIPDHYPQTGSEETLFSKLVEYLIKEWGDRLGYDSRLQTEKSTMEDVTFSNGKEVVVCDAKSNRLGRSQRAPNVKDVIKTSEYLTWLKRHNKHTQLGGFATFPSLFEWSKGSAVHTYLTNKANPIMLIYYERLALMLLFKDRNPNLLFDELKNYPKYFPKIIVDKKAAKKAFEKFQNDMILSICSAEELKYFNQISLQITTEFVAYSTTRLTSLIKLNEEFAKDEVLSLNISQLRMACTKLKAESLNGELERILANIKKFRL